MIVSITPIGLQEVYDFEVERFHNYIAGDLIHHNTELGAYELTCHLTGEYPAWWEGRVFNRPVAVWVAGDTGKTTRDILQQKLLGKTSEMGTGMIPSHAIDHTTSKAGLAEAIETVWVKHRSGGKSSLIFKSFDQRREAFQGTTIDVIWLDEECPRDIYTECLLRTMDTPELPGGGIIILTFTPLQGITSLVLEFLASDVDKPEPVIVEIEKAA